MAQRFGVTSSTTVRTATPTPGTAPVTGRYTRYVALHLLWGAAPDQNGCTAYGSGAPPTPTSPNADMHTSPRAGSTPHTANDQAAPAHRPSTPPPRNELLHQDPLQPPLEPRNEHPQRTPPQPSGCGGVTQIVSARNPGALPRGNVTNAAPYRDVPTSAKKRERSAALEVVLRGDQDLLPHADRVVVRLASHGLVVGNRC